MKNVNVSYKKGIERIAGLITEGDMNIFRGSSILAIIFDKDKHETFNDLAEYRKKELGIKVIPKKDR